MSGKHEAECRSPNTSTARGIALITAASIIIPFGDGLVKLVSNDYAAPMLVWLRYGLQSLFLLPIMLMTHGRGTFMTRQPASQLLRSLFITGAAVFFFTAVATTPLADTVAIFFVAPFITTALAPLVLGERIGPWRWSAVITGFIGALVIIRPGFQTIEIGTIFALASGLCFALFILVTRRLSGVDPPMVTNFLTGVGVTLIVSPAIPFVWEVPEARHLPIILGSAAIGTLFSFFVVLAYHHAPASLLAPFSYVELIGAVAAGWILFGELPDSVTWVGIAIIAASGIVIAWRERVVGKRAGRSSGTG